MAEPVRFYLVMGVSGSGKSAVGAALAGRLGWDFYDADDFHPPANIKKMAGGVPLTDEDRAPWLSALAELVAGSLRQNRPGVLACSALKESYRRQLTGGSPLVKVVHLRGSFDLILERMAARPGHFMKPAMLRSQFEALEAPPDALSVEITPGVEEIVEQIMSAHLQKAAFGIMGLGVMGRSLALNLRRNGISVLGYDPAPKTSPDFPIPLAADPAELAAGLAAPRKILLMVPAGSAVDTAVASLLPHLDPGDILIDGGNSFFADTARRVKDLSGRGIAFVGMGVSGGESGALYGPSLMPGGDASAREALQPILQAVAARAPDGAPCAAWIGPGGAGHFVKMVHNGIEYADMQLIAEIYDLLHRGAGMSNRELSDLFARWNEGGLRSYLVEITARILAREEDGVPLVDLILDEAAQKGTGKWTSQVALDLGVPTPGINAAVEGRLLSSLKKERSAAAGSLGGAARFNGDVPALAAAAEKALYASKITSYAQGFAMLRAASAEYGWELDFAAIAALWRAGCIIRAGLLEKIRAAFERSPALANLMLDDFFRAALLESEPDWRVTAQTAAGLGIPILAVSASLAYFDAYRSQRLPANLNQAQRDYFGAHTYRRTDREGVFHTDWEQE